MKTEDTIFIDTKQLAERWRMDARSIHNLRLKNKGPSYIQPSGPNGKVLYDLNEIKKWEERSRVSNEARVT